MARLLIVLLLSASSAPVFAYIGPGAGVSFLGSVWAVLAGIFLALVAILAWPVRYMIRRLRKGRTRSVPAPPPVE